MYCKHFGFRMDPFSVSPDPRFFYETEQHREAVATLYYAMLQRRGFALLVGRPGLGKTSVLRQLALLLDGMAEVAFLPQPYFDHENLLEAVLSSLGIEAKRTAAQNCDLFNQHLLKIRGTGKTCVVILDEAQNLTSKTLEAVRMLSNFETSAQKLVQIVLGGQPRLAEKLQRSSSEQIRQRINLVSRLHPLASYQVYDYIAHRLKIAGGSLHLFAPAALSAIAAGSGGVPRNVNTICFNALSLVYALDGTTVGYAEVAEAIRDLDLTAEGHLPVMPIAPVAPSPPLARNALMAPVAPSSPSARLTASPRHDPLVVHDFPRKGPQVSGGMPLQTKFDQVFTALRKKVFKS
jgi:general secretion pathway protein A